MPGGEKGCAMHMLLPRTLPEALELKAARPEAVPIAGGTDLMVDLNFGRRRPSLMMDVSRLAELRRWRRDDGTVALGSGVTYTQIVAGLSDCRPLVEASRTVGSPQIRNRGTVGGNLGTASPAGDALPVLAAYDAEVTLVAAGGRRRTMPWHQFMTGPKKTAIRQEELILETGWRFVRGTGSFSKVGTRNAMVIAVASLCLILDEDRRAIRVALGSVGPTVLRAPDAERFASEVLARVGLWDDSATALPPKVLNDFGERVAAAAVPIDDVRGTAAYRRHACAVMARRALAWALHDRTRGTGQPRSGSC